MVNLDEFKNVDLCIVSKKQSKENILEYYNLGYKIFGENKVQELLEKIDIADDIEWHFIGHLQSNKVKYIVEFVSLIHSVDSIKLVKEINYRCNKINKIMDILIQFNISNEKTKFGLKIDDAYEFIQNCQKFTNINVKGIMLMGPNCDDENKIRETFKTGYKLFESLKQKFPSISILSMGMSNDYKIAIEEGSTMVRIGSLLFNEKKSIPKKHILNSK